MCNSFFDHSRHYAENMAPRSLCLKRDTSWKLPFCIHVLDYCHLQSTWVCYCWLLRVLLLRLTHLHTPGVFCNVDAQLYSLVIIFTCWCMASVLVISLSLQQSNWVLPSGNAVFCCRSSVQLFIQPQVVHHRQHSLSQLCNCFFGHLLACSHLFVLWCDVCLTTISSASAHAPLTTQNMAALVAVAYQITNLSFMLLLHVSRGLCFVEHWQTACTWSYSVRFWWWMSDYSWPYWLCGRFPSSHVLEINVIN